MMVQPILKAKTILQSLQSDITPALSQRKEKNTINS